VESVLPLIIILVFIVAMFYFTMIRPLKQREKKHDQMVNQLEIGDQVMTAGGIYGVVEQIDDESIVLKLEDGRMRVTKGGVISRQIREE
jgi:preprotein translocase subunit YajC